MTTIQAYLAVAGNDTNNNDLRTALTTEGFILADDIGNAASENLRIKLENTYHVPIGFVGRFIAAANARQAQRQLQQAQAQAQAQGVPTFEGRSSGSNISFTQFNKAWALLPVEKRTKLQHELSGTPQMRVGQPSQQFWSRVEWAWPKKGDLSMYESKSSVQKLDAILAVLKTKHVNTEDITIYDANHDLFSNTKHVTLFCFAPDVVKLLLGINKSSNHYVIPDFIICKGKLPDPERIIQMAVNGEDESLGIRCPYKLAAHIVGPKIIDLLDSKQNPVKRHQAMQQLVTLAKQIAIDYNNPHRFLVVHCRMMEDSVSSNNLIARYIKRKHQDPEISFSRGTNEFTFNWIAYSIFESLGRETKLNELQKEYYPNTYSFYAQRPNCIKELIEARMSEEDLMGSDEFVTTTAMESVMSEQEVKRYENSIIDRIESKGMAAIHYFTIEGTTSDQDLFHVVP